MPFSKLALLLALTLPAAAQPNRQSLNDQWTFRALDPIHPEVGPATVPGVIQTDLRAAGLIPDPFFADNEKRLQWIGETDWEYTRTLDIAPATLTHQHVDLVFDGLDTLADVTLNGQPVLQADNQFRSWRVDAKPFLHPGRNTLRIVFLSPVSHLSPEIAKLPYIIPGTGYEAFDRAHNIFPISQYLRQAPYQYGWDWGPKFVTAGIWRPIHLDTWDDARIVGFHLQQNSVTEARANLTADLTVDATAASNATLDLTLTSPNQAIVHTEHLQVQLDPGNNRIQVPFRLDKPERWFPNGYGPQARYTADANLRLKTKLTDHATLKTGLRSVELQRIPDRYGTSFTFVINGVPVFAKGANFVPLDSFPTSTTHDKKRQVLTAARDVHMNMLRIWGGGFYETDDFYDLADELGLMIWQEFAFGGALVPGDKPFQDNVRAEAAEQVARLSDHPSLVLWCGNNEVETAWREWGDHQEFKKSITPDQRERVWQDYVVLFRDILKSEVATYGNGIPYWPSSPGSDFEDVPPRQLNGDDHSWKVWSAGAPITDYRKVQSRFVSEFGFQAMPDLRTVRAEAGPEEDLASPALLNHERFAHGYDRMKQYLTAEFRPARDFPSFVYLSQLMQAEAIQLAVEHLRSLRPETMGALYWQLDDCWPVASWSSLDYFGRWKALHFYARRFYAPLLIAAEVENTSAGSTLNLHLVSDLQTPTTGILHLRLMNFDGTVLQQQTLPANVAPLASTPIGLITLKPFDPKAAVAVLTLESGGKELAANTVYFIRSADLALPHPTITPVLRRDATGYTLELRSPTLARAVQLSFGTLDAQPDDNFFDLLPNQPRAIHLTSPATLAQLQTALTLRSLATAQTP